MDDSLFPPLTARDRRNQEQYAKVMDVETGVPFNKLDLKDEAELEEREVWQPS